MCCCLSLCVCAPSSLISIELSGTTDQIYRNDDDVTRIFRIRKALTLFMGIVIINRTIYYLPLLYEACTNTCIVSSLGMQTFVMTS